MSKANNTKAIIFTVTLLSFMVILIAGTIFYVYKDPVISETVATEQTVETTETTMAVREKRVSVYGTSDIQGKIIDSSSGDKTTYQYRLAYMAKIFSDARTSGDYDDVLLVDLGDFLDLLGSEPELTAHTFGLVVGQGGHVYDTSGILHVESAATGETASARRHPSRRPAATRESAAAHRRLRRCGSADKRDPASDRNE